MKLKEILSFGEAALSEAGIYEAALESRLLMEHVLQLNRAQLILKSEAVLSQEQIESFEQLIQERRTGRPIQYVLGEWDFFGLRFIVNQHTLIPRPETETLVSLAILALNNNPEPLIFDIGTGTCCIPISILMNHPGAVCIGVDLSEDALKIAQTNVDMHQLSERITLLHSDLFAAIPEHQKADLILSNPPYIETAEISRLDPKVKDHEPLMALDGGEDGLVFYKQIINEAPDHLRPGGVLLFEIGHNQADAVTKLLEAKGFKDISKTKDYADIDRFIQGTMGTSE